VRIARVRPDLGQEFGNGSGALLGCTFTRQGEAGTSDIGVNWARLRSFKTAVDPMISE